MTLAATPTAVNVGLLLLQHTLTQWSLRMLVDAGEALLAEMLAEAVRLTGVRDPYPRWVDLDDLALVRLRLLLFDYAFVIEVTDRHEMRPTPSDGFQALTRRWGYLLSNVGRVVWCELELPHSQQSSTTAVDMELLRRVHNALKDL